MFSTAFWKQRIIVTNSNVQCIYRNTNSEGRLLSFLDLSPQDFCWRRYRCSPIRSWNFIP